MASINLIKASDGTGNASTATVQTVRNSGVTTIIVDTVNNIPATFMGSMGTPHTFVDPVTSEEITVISEATAVDFTGHVSGANLEIDSIAPGYTDLGSAVGDIIVIRPTTAWANNIATVLAVAHSDTGAITTNAIAEKTAAAGVTIDGVLLKDGYIYGKAVAYTIVETDGVAITTSYTTVGSQVLPSVTAAHKYLITTSFAVNNLGSTTNLSFTPEIAQGTTQISSSYITMPSGSYISAPCSLSTIFTSSASGGQTINFRIKNETGNSGESHWSGKFTIVDLGLA